MEEVILKLGESKSIAFLNTIQIVYSGLLSGVVVLSVFSIVPSVTFSYSLYLTTSSAALIGKKQVKVKKINGDGSEVTLVFEN